MKNLLPFILIFIFFNSNAQKNDFSIRIKKTFNIEDQLELEIIFENLKEVELIDADIQIKNMLGYTSEALELSKKISQIYSEEYRDLFLIYEKELNRILDTKEAVESDFNVKYYLRKSKNSFRLSISERLLEEKTEDEKESLDLLLSAHNNEVNAIEYQSKSFALIYGWITEPYFKAKESQDYSETQFDNSSTSNFEEKVFANNDTKQLNDNNLNGDSLNNSLFLYATRGVVLKENNSKIVNKIFRIQLIESEIPIKESKINELNLTELKVQVFKSGKIYRYTVGDFLSFDIAKEKVYEKALTSKKIIEYINDKEVKVHFLNE